jgi:hypothetical protein
MPVILEYVTSSGKKARLKLPVEVWQNSVSAKVKIPTTEELSLVEIDPDKVFPDYFPENNIWKDIKE